MDPRIPVIPPVIKPIPEGDNRTLWSVMIPVYNCSKYFPETLESVLLQNISEKHMQIEVVDDASTDADVEALVSQIGGNRVKYYRQPRNVGSLRNFETCLNRSKGNLIHLLHGDDKVRPGFYKKMEYLYETNPEIGAAFCRVGYITENGDFTSLQKTQMDHDGILQNWLLRIAEINQIQYAAITIRREVYEKLGSFYASTYSEDWEMWVRIAKNYPVAYTPEYLAEYREHNESITARTLGSGEMFKDLIQIMNLIQNHIPQSERKKVLQKSKNHYGWYWWHMASNTWKQFRYKDQTQNIIKQAIMINNNKNIKLQWELGKLYIKTLMPL